MAQAVFTATTSWVKITAAGSTATDDFVLQNRSDVHKLGVAYGGAPSATEQGFAVKPNSFFARGGVPGDLYVRSLGYESIEFVLAGV